MECPRCRSSLNAQAAGEVEVDICPGCRGTWLDAGELQALMSKVPPATEGRPALEGRAAGEGEAPQGGGSMGCPRCPEAALGAFVYLGDSGIELDRCPECEGLWLDGGELDRIEELVARNRKQAEVDVERFTRDGAMRESGLWRVLKEIGRSLMTSKHGGANMGVFDD